MLIGHFQCECRQGCFDANLKTVVRGLESAERMGLEIVSFPEAFLTGYFKKEEDARKNCFAVESPEMERVLATTADFSPLFMVGFNELRGDQLYNSVAVVEGGKLLGIYSKAFPIYKYFEPGRDFPVFRKGELTFGVAICADTAFIEPVRILALEGARVIFAPHFNFTKDPVEHYLSARGHHIARAAENGVYLLRANNIVDKKDLGDDPERPKIGYGDSYLIDPAGQIVAACGLHEEYLMVYNLDLSRTYRYNYKKPSRSLRSARALLDTLAAVVEEKQAGE